ncbi:unnamed protein product [Trichobilharzia szidati]|nr:unnamed protein product [Trichobilharzia szidati]
MAFAIVSLETTAFIFLLRASLLTAMGLVKHNGLSERRYDVNRLTKEIDFIEQYMNTFAENITRNDNYAADYEVEMKMMRDDLETQAAEKETTITEFVQCQVNTCEEYYRQKFYNTISRIIRNVNQSYAGFFVMPSNNTLWNESLIHGSKVNRRSAESTLDWTVCDDLLLTEPTEELDNLKELIIMATATKFTSLRYHETKAIFDNILANLKIERALMTSNGTLSSV